MSGHSEKHRDMLFVLLSLPLPLQLLMSQPQLSPLMQQLPAQNAADGNKPR